MTRRFRAVPAAAQGSTLRLTVQMTPVGAAPVRAAVSSATPASVATSIVGPFRQRSSSAGGVDVFFLSMFGLAESDVVQWVSPCGFDGIGYDLPDTAVTITAVGLQASISYTYTYPQSVNVACFVNGALYVGNVELGL